MDLEKTINNDIKETMLARDHRKLEALRGIKAALLLIKTSKEVGGGAIPEEMEMKMLQKLVKQRKESAEIYQSQGREDLAGEELYQAGIIEQYLPKQLSGEEIRIAIQQIITVVGATGPKDLGKVMGLASKQLAGKADNKIISAIVKEILGA
jgi:uncharacterized protein YqeY